MFASRQATRLQPSLQLLLLVPPAAGRLPGAQQWRTSSTACLRAAVRVPRELRLAAAKGDISCACRVLHTRLADKCPADNLGIQVKHHRFNLKLTYKVEYTAT